MDAARLLAFDLGAESGRAVLGDLAGGRLALREIARFPNGLLELRGRLHWNVFRLFEEMKAALAACAAEGIAPASLGVDTWGVDFALLAADGTVLGLPVAYRDRRTEGAMESLFRKIPRERVYARTGIQLLPINTLFQLEAMARDRSPLREVATDLLFIPDLFHYLLTGVKRTEFTFATTSQLFDPVRMDWDDELLRAVGAPRAWMQEVVPPGTILGELDGAVRRRTGYAGGPLVAVATHDTGSAVAAVPAQGEDWAFISSGTWSLVGVESPRPVLTLDAMRANVTSEGGVGGTFRVLKNVTGLWLLQECRRAWSRERPAGYDELIAAAGAAPPFAALVDPDDPSFLAPPDMPEAIRAFCVRTGQAPPGTRGATVRCILESLALKCRLVLEQIARLLDRRIARVHVIGGGARNGLLCRFTADATGLPVRAGPGEATAVGNLLVQAMALGRIASLAELREVVRASFAVTRYDPDDPAAWEPARERFRKMAG